VEVAVPAENLSNSLDRRDVLLKSTLMFAAASMTAGATLPVYAAANDQQDAAKISPVNGIAHGRAVDAVIWGQPIVTFAVMRDAYFRDAKAQYNDIVWWPKGMTWKNQTLTPNMVVRYIMIFSNTKTDGPVVLDLPGAIASASFYGTISDAWFLPLVDVGSDGEDDGKGGKYLILPPDYKGTVPSGYIAVRPSTYNAYTIVRSILKDYSPDTVSKGNALVNQMKFYPLIKAADPPKQRFIDLTDILFEGLPRYDASLYTSLAGMLNEEPVQERDLVTMGKLLDIGIEKGKEFKPDPSLTGLLGAAAREAHAWLVEELVTRSTERLWPGSKWVVPVPTNGVKTLFKWEWPNYFDVDSRAISMASFYAPPTKLGKGSYYLASYVDATDQRLRGENSYKLHVPANVPVREFWGVTVYNQETAALFRESTRVSVGSLDQGVLKNSDGSVDIYFGPKPASGNESNWLYTEPGKGWYPWFRFYGAEDSLFSKNGSWELPAVQQQGTVGIAPR
jgi:hypothetical protein